MQDSHTLNTMNVQIYFTKNSLTVRALFDFGNLVFGTSGVEHRPNPVLKTSGLFNTRHTMSELHPKTALSFGCGPKKGRGAGGQHVNNTVGRHPSPWWRPVHKRCGPSWCLNPKNIISLFFHPVSTAVPLLVPVRLRALVQKFPCV